MPTYQYRCTACGHEFEEIQSMAAQPLTDCPNCNGKVERLISGGAGVLFKGSGFYITDYRSESYKSAAKKESGSGADTPSSSSPSSSGSPAGGASASQTSNVSTPKPKSDSSTSN